MAVRRHPEDSVIVSIGDVRDMLAEEVGRQSEATQPRLPVPMPVPAEVVGGVPSWEEVGASRQARWGEERVAPVPSMPPWRIWRRRVVLAIAALAVAAGSSAALWFWMPPPLAVEGMVAVSRSTLLEVNNEAALRASGLRHAELAQETDRLRLEVQRLEEALVAAKQSVQAPVSAGQDVEITGETKRAPRVLSRRSPVAQRSQRAQGVPAKRTPRKPRTLNKTDAKLDSLLNGL